MGIINLLPKTISELIAAGEVIERPASIVKELLENSIDAESSAVTIEIKRGGITYIRITDNGKGLAPEDLKVAFLRHATSKISNSQDLDTIGTLGFRGEALASISAVTKIQMVSKTVERELGSSIILEGGEEIDFDDVGAPNGTTIIVTDLFYNVPARLKFLKKDLTEAYAITSIVDKIALSHPEISFKLISDNKVRLFTPGNNDLFATIHSIYGSDFSSDLIKVFYETDDIKVSGLVCSPKNLRSNRSLQNFFVNSRFVKSKTCTTAIEEAFKETTMVGRYPSCVINIEVPFNTVDVNVHPAKIEIRFINERTVFDAIYFAIKSALSQNDILKPMINKPMNASKNILSTFKNNDESNQLDLINTQKSSSSSVNSLQTDTISSPFVVNSTDSNNNDIYKTYESNQPVTQQEVGNCNEQEVENCNEQDNKISLSNTSNTCNLNVECDSVKFETINDTEISEVVPPHPKITICENDVKEDITLIKEKSKFIKIIGEIFKTYFLFEFDNTLYLMDKHAGHERILYEKLKKSLETDNRQTLLSPIIITLSSEEFKTILDNKDIFNKLGFLVDEFGGREVVVREIPLYLPLTEVKLSVLDITQKISENRKNILGEYYEHLLHSIACRCAIKSNDSNTDEELTILLQEIFENDDLRNCPHGRPIVVDYPKSDFDKKFGRI